MATRKKSGESSYGSISRSDLPFGRKGKHHRVIADVLEDLAALDGDRALKIPLGDLSDSKANIRSALSRAAKLLGIEIATSSDESYLYVWKPSPSGNGKEEK